jgi:hypothetical protein
MCQDQRSESRFNPQKLKHEHERNSSDDFWVDNREISQEKHYPLELFAQEMHANR